MIVIVVVVPRTVSATVELTALLFIPKYLPSVYVRFKDRVLSASNAPPPVKPVPAVILVVFKA